MSFLKEFENLGKNVNEIWNGKMGRMNFQQYSQPVQYSREWARRLSDRDFYREREKLRQIAVFGPGYDPRIDRIWEMMCEEDHNRRDLANASNCRRDPNKPPYHTEHGYFLPEDDD